MPDRKKPAILIVDDLAENRLALQSLLEPLQARLICANSAAAALDLLLVNDVALALVDVQMPEMNGFDLAELMRGAERTRSVPIIFVTAGGPNLNWQFRGYDAGAVDFLFKPLDPRVVLSKVRIFLDLFSQRMELDRQARVAEGARLQAQFLNEKLEVETALRDRFVAALSHDLRSPLTATRLSAQMIEMQKEPSKAMLEKYTQKIIKNMDRADAMITDLLDVSRLEAGKPIPLNFEKVDLDALLARIAEDLRLMYGARIALDSNTALQGIWNEEAIRRLIENLVSNAVKYGHHSAAITIRALAEGERALITVHNEGVPIPLEEQDRLFDRFHRTASAVQAGKKGWGIGLAVCRGIVNALGGELRVGSAEGRGTSFFIDLPLDSRAVQNLEVRAPSAEKKILIVDDTAATRYTLKRLLEREKYRVFEAASGTDGILIARAERPHAIILSVNLADMNGLDVCRSLRRDASFSDVRIIETSASEPDAAEYKEMMSAGADDCLVHPVDPEALLKKIAECFQDSPQKVSV